jgi:hypothetical protein
MLGRRGPSSIHDHERRTLTDQVRSHNRDDGLFRTPGQEDERQLASDVTDARPMTRPSRNLFHHAVNRGAEEHQRPTAQRDEASMRSLRFPFDDSDCR